MNVLTILRNTFHPEGTAAAANETCAACGQPFYCGASLRGCWCTEVQLNEAQRATLRQSYPTRQCLCRSCLEQARKQM